MKTKLYYEFKSMGANKYLPPFFLLVFYLLSFSFKEPGEYILNVQTLVPLFISVWSTFAFYDYIEDEGRDLFLLYSKSIFDLIIRKNNILSVIYLVFSIPFVTLMNLRFLNELAINFNILISMQIVFVSSLSLLFMVIFKTAIWSILGSFVYTFVIIGYTRNDFFLNIYSIDKLEINYLKTLSLKAIIFSFVLMLVVNYLLKRRYN